MSKKPSLQIKCQYFRLHNAYDRELGKYIDGNTRWSVRVEVTQHPGVSFLENNLHRTTFSTLQQAAEYAEAFVREVKEVLEASDE